MLGCLHFYVLEICVRLVLRLIMNMYISQRMQVRFGTAMSSHFSISNGVKQGSVLSPILFTIYIDNLIVQLRKFNIGCKMGNINFRCFWLCR